MGLEQCRRAAEGLQEHLKQDEWFVPMESGPQLDIVVWKCGPDSAALSSELAQKIFASCAERNLHLALVQLPEHWFGPVRGMVRNPAGDKVTCLRSVLMKPEHAVWLGRIWDTFTQACRQVRA